MYKARPPFYDENIKILYCALPNTTFMIFMNVFSSFSSKNRVCKCSKLPSSYFPKSPNQIAVLLTEFWTAYQTITKWFYLVNSIN